MLHMPVTQKTLNRPRILLIVGELIATPMPKLMWMHREAKLGNLTRLDNHFADAHIGQRSLAL
jgi:hypothetical protein